MDNNTITRLVTARFALLLTAKGREAAAMTWSDIFNMEVYYASIGRYPTSQKACIARYRK